MNSMILHQLFFAGLGDESELGRTMGEAIAKISARSNVGDRSLIR
jgi:hypothetical protein